MAAATTAPEPTQATAPVGSPSPVPGLVIHIDLVGGKPKTRPGADRQGQDGRHDLDRRHGRQVLRRHDPVRDPRPRFRLQAGTDAGSDGRQDVHRQPAGGHLRGGDREHLGPPVQPSDPVALGDGRDDRGARASGVVARPRRQLPAGPAAAVRVRAHRRGRGPGGLVPRAGVPLAQRSVPRRGGRPRASGRPGGVPRLTRTARRPAAGRLAAGGLHRVRGASRPRPGHEPDGRSGLRGLLGRPDSRLAVVRADLEAAEPAAHDPSGGVPPAARGSRGAAVATAPLGRLLAGGAGTVLVRLAGVVRAAPRLDVDAAHLLRDLRRAEPARRAGVRCGVVRQVRRLRGVLLDDGSAVGARPPLRRQTGAAQPAGEPRHGPDGAGSGGAARGNARLDRVRHLQLHGLVDQLQLFLVVVPDDAFHTGVADLDRHRDDRVRRWPRACPGSCPVADRWAPRPSSPTRWSRSRWAI